jgi:hypothetical protein
MSTIVLANLGSDTLRSRLAVLACEERQRQRDFLALLGEFDRRQAYLPLGFGSLFDYLTTELRYSKGAAFRRMVCARLLRLFPQAGPMLGDGRLCLTTLAALRDVLDERRADRVLAAACGKTKEEVAVLVAALQPRPPVRDALRPASAPMAACAARGIGWSWTTSSPLRSAARRRWPTFAWPVPGTMPTARARRSGLRQVSARLRRGSPENRPPVRRTRHAHPWRRGPPGKRRPREHGGAW